MKKIGKLMIMVTVMTTVLLTNTSFVQATSNQTKQMNIQDYLKVLNEEIENLNKTGQTVYLAKTTNRVDNEIPANIYKKIDGITAIIKKVNEYNDTLSFQDIEKQHISSVLIVLENIKSGYNALLPYYYAVDTVSAYNELGVFYYYLTYAANSNSLLNSRVNV